MSIAIEDTTLHLFVYGTLRQGAGHPLHRLLSSEAHFVGNGWFSGRLYDLGSYPGAVRSSDSSMRVIGEIYRLPAARSQAILSRLDAYEGCGGSDHPPFEFVRTTATIYSAKGPLHAWIYLYNQPVAGLREIPHGDYLNSPPAG